MLQKANYPSLQDAIVLITGGAAGIGEVMVKKFAEQKARVIYIDLDAEKSHLLSQSIKGLYKYDPVYYECDLRNIEQLVKVVADIRETIGPIRVLINNAADDTRHKFEEITAEYWDERLSVNLRPCFFAAQAVAKQMKEIGGGSIINFGSASWRKKQTFMPAYTTAKAAIEGLSRTLAATLGEFNIRVNTLIPGWVMTERQLTHWLSPDIVEEVRAQQCLHKTIMPEDIADAALFLGSADSHMITAQTLIVDAGWN